MVKAFDYIIIGGGLAGALAIEGIREIDKQGAILLLSNQNHLPYDRPPLTKSLWFGKKKLEKIFLNTQEFYPENGVTLNIGSEAIEVDAENRLIKDDKGKTCSYKKLLLSTGGAPRRLAIQGGELTDIYYYRYLNDYLRLKEEAKAGKKALVIGAGFIGSEIAAALTINQIAVTMLFPDNYLVSRVFPEYLGKELQARYIEKGVTIISGAKPLSINKKGDAFIVKTDKGTQINADIVIVGIGIMPNTNLAQQAGLKIENGIRVNKYLQTSSPDIYAAGDNAYFPYRAFNQYMRIEHWDNSLNQGRLAGKNMAGASEPYTYMPFFFSDLFEFGYEAVGDVSAGLDTFADWKRENDTGVVYYLKDKRIRGVMTCNIFEQMDAARELIQKKEEVRLESLRGLIR